MLYVGLMKYNYDYSGDLASAVESFHKALGIRREDTFSTNMLTSVIEQLMDSVAPFPGYNDTSPRSVLTQFHDKNIILTLSISFYLLLYVLGFHHLYHPSPPLPPRLQHPVKIVT